MDNRIKAQCREPFVLAKQICVSRERTGEGLAARLYHHLFSRVPDAPVFAVIVLQPKNERSIRLHEPLGFELVLTETPPDGRLRGVWRRPPGQPEP